MNRRGFVSAALLGLSSKSGQAARNIAGGFVNDGFPLGHRLRDRKPGFAAPKQTIRIPAVIVGGGCAGLSAAWHLNRRGFRDFVLLEMERETGGNARWGQNEVSRYPWAAHYLPVANRESALVRELCTEIGLLKDGVWDERHLCFSPQERLYLHGRWQEGIEPEIAATRKDHDQYKKFDTLMREARATGQFTKPLEASGAKTSPDLSLDRINMREWLRRNGLDSEYLQWYVNYSCRDDYGSNLDTTSAWAGIHEFASREPEEKGPLTWPEGNGWIVERLKERVGKYLKASSPVYRISREGNQWKVWTEQTAYVADAVIWAAPTFLASYIVEGAHPKCDFVYSPWITANLTLRRMPDHAGDIAWDNVIYDSPSLGYVVATHMNLTTVQPESVWTYYWALVDQSPAAYRKLLLEKDWSYWRDLILADLTRAHRDIADCISRIDVMRLGHAMARPVPGFLASPQRKRWIEGEPGLYYANSDLSGFSIFEEAQFRGVEAAKKVLRRLS